MISGDFRQTRRPIVIIGFMGAGKTTVAREVARALNCRAIDLDALISEREKRSPGKIIKQSGEDEFRRIETEVLRQVLLEKSTGVAAHIVALGGGAWTLQRNRDLINTHRGITIWLDAPFELCWERIEASGAARPLASSREMAEKLYHERRPVYELAKVHIVISETMSAAETAGKIAETVSREVSLATSGPKSTPKAPL